MFLKTGRCKTPWVVRGFRCTHSYDEFFTQDEATYYPSWIPVDNLTGYASTAVGNLEEAFTYTSAWAMHADCYDGQVATYSGGGYLANLGTSLESATAMVSDLSANNWIDQQTKAVFVEFTTWNPSSTLFNLAMVLFEYPSDGYTLWSTRMEIVQLYRYAGANGAMALLVEILCGIMVTVVSILEVRKMCKQRQGYFHQMWNLIQIASLALFYIAVGLYAVRCIWTVWTVDDMMNNPGRYIFWMWKYPFSSIFYNAT